MIDKLKPAFENATKEEFDAFLATHVIEDYAPEDLCPCGEPISELGCFQAVCGKDKPNKLKGS